MVKLLTTTQLRRYYKMTGPEFVVSIINSFWKPGKKILDIGCGPAFLRNVYGKDYLGTDISAEPYHPDLPRDVDLVCTADNLTLESNLFDIVIIKSAFFLFEDHVKALKEAHRVLKPGGKLIIFDYNKRTQKILQKKEGHSYYPCWTQWGLKRLLQINGFNKVRNYIATSVQPLGLARQYELVRQEIKGTWAIVCGTKS